VKRQLAALATATVAAGTLFWVVPSADAATRAPIRSYTDTVSFSQTGLGVDAGWYHHYSAIERVSMRPLAVADRYSQAWIDNHGRLRHYRGVWILAGGRTYARTDGARKWTVTKLTAADLRAEAASATSYYEMDNYLAIPGVVLVAPGHYQVTASVKNASTFLADSYGLPGKYLTEAGISKVTVDLFTDQSGRPVKIIVSGLGARERLAITETFTSYNQLVSIKAPK